MAASLGANPGCSTFILPPALGEHSSLAFRLVVYNLRRVCSSPAPSRSGVHLGAYLAYALSFLPDRVVGWAWSCPGLGLGVNPLLSAPVWWPQSTFNSKVYRIGRICDPPRCARSCDGFVYAMPLAGPLHDVRLLFDAHLGGVVGLAMQCAPTSLLPPLLGWGCIADPVGGALHPLVDLAGE